MDYALVDCGEGKKLERFGPYLFIRPASVALWPCALDEAGWQQAHASFVRDNGNRWIAHKKMPESWEINLEDVRLKLKKTDFGHLGVFPEHVQHWCWMRERLQALKAPRVLNLFAYSGGATLAAAQAGAHVCHVDSSKGMVSWARENAQLNQLEKAPIRWLVEDVTRFLQRTIRRNERYEGIILDPPSFGRGTEGQVFKIEDDLVTLLELCRDALSERPSFILFSCHTPGLNAVVLQQALKAVLPHGRMEAGEMEIKVDGGSNLLPSGSYVRWTP